MSEIWFPEEITMVQTVEVSGDQYSFRVTHEGPVYFASRVTLTYRRESGQDWREPKVEILMGHGAFSGGVYSYEIEGALPGWLQSIIARAQPRNY